MQNTKSASVKAIVLTAFIAGILLSAVSIVSLAADGNLSFLTDRAVSVEVTDDSPVLSTVSVKSEFI